MIAKKSSLKKVIRTAAPNSSARKNFAGRIVNLFLK
jgi:hypothetical protein